MLTEHKSDPCYVTVTPSRRKRQLRKQKTAISRQSSSHENMSSSSSLYQFLVSTRSAVQGLGYNMRSYLFDDSRPVCLDVGFRTRAWLMGKQIETTEAFETAWSRVLRMTYRKHLPEPLYDEQSGVSYDADTGWGCTIRSCQMMVAETISRLGISRQRTASLFLDKPEALFSIHRFISSQSEKPPGQWFGPTSVALVLQRILGSPDGQPVGLGMVVSVDGRLSSAEILSQSRQEIENSFSSASTPLLQTVQKSHRANSWELCNDNPSSSYSGQSSCMEPSPRAGFIDITNSETVREEFWVVDVDSDVSEESAVVDGPWARPVLVVVAIRLSPDNEMSQAQIAALLSYMTLPSCVGVLGGPERRCHYLVGLLEDQLEEGGFEYTMLSVDPHIVQEAVVETDVSCFRNSANPSRVSPSFLCPSLALGFLLKTQADLDQLSEQLGSYMTGGFVEFTESSVGPRKSPQYAAKVVVEGNEEPLVLLESG